MRNGRDRPPLLVNRGERGLDDRFGLRTRHQRRGVDRKVEAPKFLGRR